MDATDLVQKRHAERLLQKLQQHGPIKGPALSQRVKHFIRPFDAMALTEKLVGLGLVERDPAGFYVLSDEGRSWALAAGSAADLGKTDAGQAASFAPTAT